MGLGVCTDCMKESWACSCKKDAKELAEYENAHPEIFDPDVELQFNVRAYNREGMELRTHTYNGEPNAATTAAAFAAETYLREPQILKVVIHKVVMFAGLESDDP